MLAEKIAIVTGASSGIGAEISRALAAQGVRLWLLGRDAARLLAVADEARRWSGSVWTHQVDLGLDQDIRRLVAEVAEKCGAADILVHSAGCISVGKIAEDSVDEFDKQFRVNVRGAYLLTQGLLPLLKASRGQVVFINSSVGLIAKAGSGQYSATKHALKALADTLRQEINGDGVRVTSVYPGQTATQMQASLCQVAGKAYAPERLVQPTDVAEVVLCALSLPRTAEVTDIAIRPMRSPEEKQSPGVFVAPAREVESVLF
jgi:NADP-dependent 3-hydroxy acid dehydrogenase YdfG